MLGHHKNMIENYRHYLVQQGPLIRLCFRVLILVIFTMILISSLFTITEKASSNLWNPFKRIQKRGQSHVKKLDIPPQEDEDEILNTDPKYPRIRDWLYDHIYFSFYDGSRLYTNQEYIGGTVSRKPHREEQYMLNLVQQKALRYFENKIPGKYTKEECDSIRYRMIPTMGIEADVICKDTNTKSVDRMSILLPINPPKITYHHSVNSSTSINIIMPLRGRIDTLKIFLANLINILQGTPNTMGLTVVYFEDGNTAAARHILAETESKISKNLKTEFILLEGQPTFSRSRGLQVGINKTSLKGEILFFCDVDVLFTKDFLSRCISTPVQGHQIFIPMIFSLYNPEFVYPFHKHKMPSPLKQLNVDDDYGFWRVWGHGMVCIYKSDLKKIGGFEESRSGWGGEDIAFVRRIINTGEYKIIRPLDPGLFHRYHTKECSNARNHKSCLTVKAMTEASKQALGLWYFNRNEGVSVYGALVKGNQPHYHDEEENDPREYHNNGFTEQRTPIEEALVSQNSWLAKFLILLVLISVIFVDMVLMIYNWRQETKRSIS